MQMPPEIQIPSLQTCCKTSRRRRPPWHGNSRPLCERKRSRHPSNSCAWSFYTVAWISRYGKPQPISRSCMSRLPTRLLRSAWPPVGRGCRPCWRNAAYQYRRHASSALAFPGHRRQSRPRPWRPGHPVSPAHLYGLGAVTVCLHYRHGSAYRRKPRPLPVGAWGYCTGGPWVCLCHAHCRDGQETGRRHPPDEPGPSARLRWATANGSISCRCCASSRGKPADHRRPGAGAATWERCAAISTRIVCRRNRPIWPASVSARRVGRKGARQKTRRCFGPAGSSSSRPWLRPCCVLRPSAPCTV